MNKILTCNTCGILFISDKEVTTCSKCSIELKINADPFEVAPKNIMKLVVQYEAVKTVRGAVNALKELDFVTNRAYMIGYISQELYEEVCLRVGLVPKYDSYVSLDDEVPMDYSDSARAGFYYDMCVTNED